MYNFDCEHMTLRKILLTHSDLISEKFALSTCVLEGS